MSDVRASEKQDEAAPIEEALKNERYELLRRLEDTLETPMMALALVWLALLVGELIWGENLLFEIIGTIIWAIFILDFSMEFVLAPHKVAYLKNNWLTAMSLLIPALRLFRIFRVFRLLRLARVGRSLRLLRVVSSLNRGMRALAASLSRRGFGYIIALTVRSRSPARLGCTPSRTSLRGAWRATVKHFGGPRWSLPRWARSTGRRRPRGACCVSFWRCMLLPSSAM